VVQQPRVNIPNQPTLVLWCGLATTAAFASQLQDWPMTSSCSSWLNPSHTRAEPAPPEALETLKLMGLFRSLACTMIAGHVHDRIRRWPPGSPAQQCSCVSYCQHQKSVVSTIITDFNELSEGESPCGSEESQTNHTPKYFSVKQHN